ncbi:MAG: tyrosine--tRNA ligase [Thaumarchaeota archaeon]|nr:tyrosine--tRNA ligase [Nitrososphaerota archaeon]MDD9825406.1 tyrosine--tRNA ligase [Nitrososphaerota archaeon]
MDVHDRLALIEGAPTEEVVTRPELEALLGANDSPRHYIGLEVSGFLHLGSLLSTGYKINDFAAAGCRCTVLLADWHTMLNDKLGADLGAISRVSRYYRDAFSRVCPGAEILTGTELYAKTDSYWGDVAGIARHVSLARAMRTLTIMGRSESDGVDLAKLLYPPMQAADIHALDADIAHAGMDQRKIHMLAREVFPRMGWKVPVSVHQSLLPGLGGPGGSAAGGGAAAKMSKSSPASGIFIHDADAEIRKKVSRAWCEARTVEGNALLAIARDVVLRGGAGLRIERPERFGGDIAYPEYGALEADYASGALHPSDLKSGVAEALVSIVGPVRDSLRLDEEVRALISGAQAG